jgi:hypothetical protein
MFITTYVIRLCVYVTSLFQTVLSEIKRYNLIQCFNGEQKEQDKVRKEERE